MTRTRAIRAFGTLDIYPRTRAADRARRAAFAALACVTLAAASTPACKRAPKTRTPGAVVPTPRARAAYVTNNGSDSLSVLDRDGALVTTVPVDVDADEKEAPHHLAVDAPVDAAVDGPRGAVYVALAFPAPPKATRDPHGSHGNAESRGMLARLDLETLAVTDTRELDHNPGEILLTHDRTRLLVSHFDMKRAMNVAARGGSSGEMFATRSS